ncbi:MFS transporter [Streptomyces polyrhachis]|uniref:MFS transporter n=1 Tax=Streptomyces polyrhachis TaxID=1282885 RepID=A0ABW2G7A4_9ACTN
MTTTESTRAQAAAPSAAELPRIRRRTTAVLVLTQVLGGLGVAIGIALSALLAQETSGSEALSGLAATSSVAGTAVLALPLASLMSRRGRRAGLVLAYLIGAAGAALVVLAAVVGSFPLLLLGMAAFGAGSSANLQARFAAADLAEPRHRGRAIATVVWATTVGAVLGPNIAGPAGRSVTGLADGRIPAAAGPFVWAAGVFLVVAVVVAVALRPDPLLTARALLGPQDSGRPESRSLRASVAAVRVSPMARLALLTIAVSHTAMVAIMVMTPLDLVHHGADIELIGLVFSSHILGMYAFSPVMGWLADRSPGGPPAPGAAPVGRISVIGLSVVLLSLAALLAGTARGDHVQSAAALFLLGLGWSAGLVAGSALLTDSVPQEARAGVQGLADLSMSSLAGAGGALAGVVVAQAGYGWLNALGACLLVPVAVLALLTRGRMPRTS